MNGPAAILPSWIRVLERGWLSSNNVVLLGDGEAALVDSGYWSHAAQTVSLVDAVIGRLPLVQLVNTHLHSDHCGGNATLQSRHRGMRTLIPPGLARAVLDWDEVALTYQPTGQTCPRFQADGVLRPGEAVTLAGRDWKVFAAPGHDPHSVILFEPGERILISADALWENGFGIVFPEIEGEHAFDSVAGTLDVIESLRPAWVIPGHGPVFSNVDLALSRARSRLDAYVADPRRHASHAAKVLLKFKLLELQRVSETEFVSWAESTPYLGLVHDRFSPATELRVWIEQSIADLARSGALRRESGVIQNV